MTQTRLSKLLDPFASRPDPQINRRKLHDLVDIVALAICAILAGCNEYTAMEAFGQAKATWLKTFLRLPNGIPSHDATARRRASPGRPEPPGIRWSGRRRP
jgi:hypothetical protein